LQARAESRTTPSEQVNTQEKGGREQQARAESKTTPSEQDLPHVVNKKNGCVVVVVCRGWFVGVRQQGQNQEKEKDEKGEGERDAPC
jgi:hypothetical protein